MKKNNALMRASGILLVLTLGTSCFVGGTFAKYVSEGEGTDSARVAKWGVEVEVTGDAFNTYYGKDDAGAELGTQIDTNGDSVVDGNDKQVSVVSSTEENVVAPGTSGTFGGVKITGEPEVAVNIEGTVDTLELENWTTDKGQYYCPLVFKIEKHYRQSSGSGGSTPQTEVIEEVNGLDYRDVNSFVNAIKKAIQENITKKNVQAGTDLSKIYLEEGQMGNCSASYITFSWEWPFQNADGTQATQTDELDTQLGDKAADGDDSNDPKVNIAVKTTVTQID